MKINSITLNNIGPYAGMNTFDFSTTDEKNIILIGGKNGAGKTTLLKAFKIGLFGCFAYGYKTENSSYYKEVKDILSNKAIGKKYSISIAFEYIERRIIHSYRLTRAWAISPKDSSITESIYITQDNILLETAEANDLINKIRSMTSPALINSFVYDGEKVGSIVESGNISSFLQGVFDSIFNIDILNQFQKDLVSYLNSKETSISAEEYELTGYINRINSIKIEEKTEADYMSSLAQHIEDLKIQIASLQKEFEKIGGLSKEKCIKLQDVIKGIEKTSETNNKTLKIFYDEYLPFYIVRKNFLRAAKQAEEELPTVYREMLLQVQDYMKVDLSQYIDMLSITSASKMYHLTKEEIDDIYKTVSYVNEKRKQLEPIISNKNNLIEQLSSIRNTITANAEIERIDSIIEQIASMQSELAKSVEEIQSKQIYLADLLKEKTILINKYEELFDKQKKEKLLGNSFVLCSKTMDVCKHLKEYLIETKLALISKTCCTIFNKTIRKDSYLSSIDIDVDFNMKLFSDNKEVSINYLSAGEMQILVSCIIWAMFKVSGRREMFIFDTPLARLDEENRITFSKNIVSTISGQVVILSTDSEFTGKNYRSISNRIAREYLLDYDDKAKITKVKTTYFGENKQ